jgi:hypothetical protein
MITSDAAVAVTRGNDSFWVICSYHQEAFLLVLYSAKNFK